MPISELPERKAPSWLAWAVFGVLWFILIRYLAVHWSANTQYSYGWLVPLLGGYLFYHCWVSRPPCSAPRHSQGVFALLAFAAFAFLPTWLLAQPCPDWRIVSWSLALEIVVLSLGALFFMGGINWLKHFAFPVCFILTAVPLPDAIEQAVTQDLMRWVAAITVEALNLVNIAAFQRGNVIEISKGMLGVDQACSGVRSMQATFMMTLCLGELRRLDWPKRACLVLTGVILVFGCNIGRAFLLGWVAAHDGMEAISKWHDPAGFTILAIAFLGVWGLSSLFPESPASRRTRAPTSAPHPLPALGLYLLTGWIVFAVGFTEIWYRAHESGEKIRWSFQWPVSRPGFKDTPIPERAIGLLKFDQGRAAEWKEPDGTRRAAFFLQWKPGTSRSRVLAQTHRPEICLPATGSVMTKLGTVTVHLEDLAIPFEEFEYEEAGHRIDVFYCAWQDQRRGLASSTSYKGWDRTVGLRLALNGERNLGQQVLEFAIFDSPGHAEAEAAFRREFAELVKLTPQSSSTL